MGRRDSRLGVTCVANNPPTAKLPVPTDVDSSKHQTPQSYEDTSCDARGITRKIQDASRVEPVECRKERRRGIGDATAKQKP